jgi:hypothetical protein
MEEYNVWTVLQSKLPLLIVVLVVVISIITFRVITHKKQRKADKK